MPAAAWRLPPVGVAGTGRIAVDDGAARVPEPEETKP
jgi:hypothetical protein